jgi:hypothetical protein
MRSANNLKGSAIIRKQIEHFDTIVDLLRGDGSIIVNKNLVFATNHNTAMMYSELMGKYRYFKRQNQLTNDGYFFNTVDNMRLDTGLAKTAQKNAIENLIELGLIEYELRGAPPKRYFKPIKDVNKIVNLLNKGARKITKLEKKLGVRADEAQISYSKRFETDAASDSNRTQSASNNTNGTILSNKKPNGDDGAFNKQANKVVFDIWEYYKLAVEDYFQPRKLTSKRRGKIRDMLEDFSVNEIKQAIDNIAANNFMTGQVDGNFKATIMYLFQFENMEKWIANCKVDNQMEEIDYYADLS